jgi:hypothetical protein
VPRGVRILILLALLVMMGVETYRFQKVYSREGPKRTFHFDIGYKAAYDAALNQPERPIYLEDGRWGSRLHPRDVVCNDRKTTEE